MQRLPEKNALAGGAAAISEAEARALGATEADFVAALSAGESTQSLSSESALHVLYGSPGKRTTVVFGATEASFVKMLSMARPVLAIMQLVWLLHLQLLKSCALDASSSAC